MKRLFKIIMVTGAVVHGLIHLPGFMAYMPLGVYPELPYKTTLLEGRLDVGVAGMSLFALLWLLAAVGFVTGAVLLLRNKDHWARVMLGAALLSLVICMLDWNAAYRGALIDVAFLLALVVYFGLRATPRPFPAYAVPQGEIKTVKLPGGLPAPVERFYRLTYGDEIPVYTSAVFSGRGTIRFMGIIFPARLRFTHLAGQGYHHYMETCIFQLPVLKVNEHYIGGVSRFELPFGVLENDPQTNFSANLGLWAETVYFPAVFLTTPGVVWQAVDDTTARLSFPFGAERQALTVTFDAQSGLITRFEAKGRYRDAKSGLLRWWGDIRVGKSQSNQPAPIIFAVSWEDEDSPWLVGTVEQTVYNTDVSKYIRQMGA